jgi:acetyltransferase-like isoleucine patch superfamily enzyme
MLRRVGVALLRRLMENEVDTFFLREVARRYYDLEIGEYTYGGCFNFNKIAPGTKIGKFCSFGENITIISVNHPTDWVTTHPFTYKPNLGGSEIDKRSRTRLVVGNDVWVGTNAVILPSVRRIGHGSIIAAGAVVVGDVPDFAIIAGVPGREVKKRIESPYIKAILASRWWEWPMEEIFGQATLFEDIEAFIKYSEVRNDKYEEGRPKSI